MGIRISIRLALGRLLEKLGLRFAPKVYWNRLAKTKAGTETHRIDIMITK